MWGERERSRVLTEFSPACVNAVDVAYRSLCCQKVVIQNPSSERQHQPSLRKAHVNATVPLYLIHYSWTLPQVSPSVKDVARYGERIQFPLNLNKTCSKTEDRSFGSR
ncbi:hypothetical protein CEXT_420401 [Caerostris extrusa]|uniref:Uncharacterized protein n=1 Tax=Caerostris extrusa TaxID=172846 RepID=A0AAV4T6M2_CAEEX|nr:hypothetical protein CEXT_420401 [Caerostris extrusa]